MNSARMTISAMESKCARMDNALLVTLHAMMTSSATEPKRAAMENAQLAKLHALMAKCATKTRMFVTLSKIQSVPRCPWTSPVALPGRAVDRQVLPSYPFC